MKKSKILLVVILPFLAILGTFNVKADSLTTKVGLGYYQYDISQNHTWSAYSTSNLSRTFQNASAQIDALSFEFNLSSNFISSNSYVITYRLTNDWNYSSNYTLQDALSEFGDTGILKCYLTSSSSSSSDTSICYKSQSLSLSSISNDTVLYTVSFTPKTDFFAVKLINEVSSTGTMLSSYGYSVTSIEYKVISDSSGVIIDNATQNTQNIINNQNQNTQDIIDNQGQNTQDIIDNQNQNTQDIIGNQTQNTQDIIDSNRVCTTTKFDKTDGHFDAYLDNGNLISSQNYVVTNYVEVNSSTVLKVLQPRESGSAYVCFYDSSKVKISCANAGNRTPGSTITVPTGSVYVMMTIHKSTNLPTYEIYTCKNGNQAVSDMLTDDNVDGANNSASNFFSNFNTETYGLTSVITAPLSFIQSLTSKTCSPLVLPLPYVNENLELPCMRGIYEQHFGGFLTLYQTITFGIISYWIVVRIFNLVKDFKNPDHDEIEVMDL